MIEAELHDGRILEFPDGTSPDVVRSTVQKLLGQPQEKPPATVADRLKALQGGLYRGAAGLAGLPMDTVQNAYNLGKAGIGTVAGLAGRTDLMPEPTVGTPLSSEWIANKLEGIGVNTQNPRPDDRASRFLNTAGLVTGGSAVPGATVGGTAAAALGGAVAEQIDPRLTALGAMAPAVASQVGANIKNAVAARAAPTVDTFKQAGTMPSVGQATDNVFLHGLENLAAKFPGGAGVMQKFIEGQQRAMGAQARTGVSTEAAGRAIEKGVTGEGGFIDRFRNTQNTLYDKLDKFIPQDTRIDVTRTQKALSELNAEIPGAPTVSKFFQNSRISGIRGAMKSDVDGTAGTYSSLPAWEKARLEALPPAQKNAELLAMNDGKLPYEALKKLRTLVGRELSDSTIASDVPRSKWKALYAAVSDDLGVAAKSSGQQAEQAWKMANNYSRAGIERIESVLDRVIGKGKQPEDIFKTFMPTDPDQANKVRSVMRSLEPAERQVVSEAVANRLGRAKPGAQGSEGDIFSSETFLTNWNKLSPGAKQQLFPDPPLRENMDKIAKAASQIRTGKGIYANPSGTAGSFAAYSVYLSPIAAVAGGTIAPVVAAGGAAATANLGSRMMTNPKIVEWLATPIKPNSLQATAHLARLGVIYNNTRDEPLKEELRNYISSLNQPVEGAQTSPLDVIGGKKAGPQSFPQPRTGLGMTGTRG